MKVEMPSGIRYPRPVGRRRLQGWQRWATRGDTRSAAESARSKILDGHRDFLGFGEEEKYRHLRTVLQNR